MSNGPTDRKPHKHTLTMDEAETTPPKRLKVTTNIFAQPEPTESHRLTNGNTNNGASTSSAITIPGFVRIDCDTLTNNTNALKIHDNGGRSSHLSNINSDVIDITDDAGSKSREDTDCILLDSDSEDGTNFVDLIREMDDKNGRKDSVNEVHSESDSSEDVKLSELARKLGDEHKSSNTANIVYRAGLTNNGHLQSNNTPKGNFNNNPFVNNVEYITEQLSNISDKLEEDVGLIMSIVSSVEEVVVRQRLEQLVSDDRVQMVVNEVLEGNIHAMIDMHEAETRHVQDHRPANIPTVVHVQSDSQTWREEVTAETASSSNDTIFGFQPSNVPSISHINSTDNATAAKTSLESDIDSVMDMLPDYDRAHIAARLEALCDRQNRVQMVMNEVLPLPDDILDDDLNQRDIMFSEVDGAIPSNKLDDKLLQFCERDDDMPQSNQDYDNADESMKYDVDLVRSVVKDVSRDRVLAILNELYQDQFRVVICINVLQGELAVDINDNNRANIAEYLKDIQNKFKLNSGVKVPHLVNGITQIPMTVERLAMASNLPSTSVKCIDEKPVNLSNHIVRIADRIDQPCTSTQAAQSAPAPIDLSIDTSTASSTSVPTSNKTSDNNDVTNVNTPTVSNTIATVDLNDFTKDIQEISMIFPDWDIEEIRNHIGLFANDPDRINRVVSFKLQQIEELNDFIPQELIDGEANNYNYPVHVQEPVVPAEVHARPENKTDPVTGTNNIANVVIPNVRLCNYPKPTHTIQSHDTVDFNHEPMDIATNDVLQMTAAVSQPPLNVTKPTGQPEPTTSSVPIPSKSTAPQPINNESLPARPINLAPSTSTSTATPLINEGLPGTSAAAIPITDEPEPQPGPSNNTPPIDNDPLSMIVNMFPDCSPNHITDQLARYQGNANACELIIDDLLKNKDYPKRSDMATVLQSDINRMDLLNATFNLEEFLTKFPDPVAYFAKATTTNRVFYQNCALIELQNRFMYFGSRYVVGCLQQNASSLIRTIRAKKEEHDGIIGEGATSTRRSIKKYRLTPRPAQPFNPTMIDEFFIQERNFINHEQEIIDYFENKKTERLRLIQQTRTNKEFLECGCCFDDEVLHIDMSTCTNDHLFCNDCIKRSTEVKVGEANFKFVCLSEDCDGVFPMNVLKNVLPSKMFSTVVRKVQEEEVRQAGIADLVTCPYCPFATVMPDPNYKVLKCLNPECLKETCRLCQEDNHIPLRCEEVEKKADCDRRTYVENRMTEAMLRTCHRCNKKFYKTEGCNKMTCPCGAKMCYICRAPDIDYTHFDNNKKCTLWEKNMTSLHEREANEAARLAANGPGNTPPREPTPPTVNPPPVPQTPANIVQYNQPLDLNIPNVQFMGGFGNNYVGHIQFGNVRHVNPVGVHEHYANVRQAGQHAMAQAHRAMQLARLETKQVMNRAKLARTEAKLARQQARLARAEAHQRHHHPAPPVNNPPNPFLLGIGQPVVIPDDNPVAMQGNLFNQPIAFGAVNHGPQANAVVNLDLPHAGPNPVDEHFQHILLDDEAWP